MQELIDELARRTKLNSYMIEILLNEMVALERKYCEQRGLLREISNMKTISPSQMILLTASMDD